MLVKRTGIKVTCEVNLRGTRPIVRNQGTRSLHDYVKVTISELYAKIHIAVGSYGVENPLTAIARPDQTKALTCAWPGGKSDRGHNGSELPTPKPVPLRSNTGTRISRPLPQPTISQVFSFPSLSPPSAPPSTHTNQLAFN
ncbi:unnamed protein product [Taenia asiatica]|uniref:RNA-directed RNA polymerase n=1 Tax=Taenia asiatica TaxID=60517 RepID=A0A0R3VS93_TAEAS|nr:unnamed protein product [Taenia asiatica]